MNQTLAMRLGCVRSGNIHAILIKYSVVFRLVSIFGLFMAWNEIQNHINVILSFISLFLFVFIWFLIVWRSFYLVHFDYMIFVLTGGYKWIGLSINLQTMYNEGTSFFPQMAILFLICSLRVLCFDTLKFWGMKRSMNQQTHWNQ